MRLSFARSLAAAALVGLAACGGDTPPPTQSAAVSLTLSAQSLTVAQGASQTVTATIARSNFTGDVVLSASGVPGNVTLAFAPSVIGGSATTSTISLNVTSAASAGTHPITITASGGGATASATFSLVITATGGFSLSASPVTMSLAQGTSGASTVTVVRTGTFSGPVALTVTGMPSGMTATATPTTVEAAATTSSLAIAAGATTQTGTYSLTVRGTSAGVPDQTVTVAVSVTTPPLGTAISLGFCSDDLPVWVGYQNDGGAWTGATGTVTSTGKTYSFSMTSTKGAVGITWSNGQGGFQNFFVYGTAQELKDMGTAESGTCGTTVYKTYNGSATGLTASHSAAFSISEGYASLYGADGAFTIEGVLTGPRDLVAVRQSVTNGNPDKLVIRRAVDQASGTTLPVINFGGTEAINPASATLTVTGAGSDTLYSGVDFLTANGTYVGMGYGQTATSVVYGVPSSAVIASDLHAYWAFTSANTAYRSASRYSQQLGNTTLAMGPQPPAVTPTTVSGTTPVRLRMTIPVQAEYAGMAYAEFYTNTTNVALQRDVEIAITAGYRAGATSWVAEIPAVPSSAGYDASWGMPAGISYDWDVYVSSHSWWVEEGTPSSTVTFLGAGRSSASPVAPYVQGQEAGVARPRSLRGENTSRFGPRR